MSVLPEFGVDLEEARRLVALLATAASDGAAALDQASAGLDAAGLRAPEPVSASPPPDERAESAAGRLRARLASARPASPMDRVRAAQEALAAAARFPESGPLPKIDVPLPEERVQVAAFDAQGLLQRAEGVSAELAGLRAELGERRLATGLDGFSRWLDEEAAPTLRTGIAAQAESAQASLQAYADGAAGAAAAHRTACEDHARALAERAADTLPAALREGGRPAAEAARTHRERARESGLRADGAAGATRDVRELLDRADDLGRAFDPADWSLS